MEKYLLWQVPNFTEIKKYVLQTYTEAELGVPCDHLLGDYNDATKYSSAGLKKSIIIDYTDPMNPTACDPLVITLYTGRIKVLQAPDLSKYDSRLFLLP